MTEIKAEKRAILGKQTASLRRAGMLPAVLYGEGILTTPLSISARDFEKAFSTSGETSILTLKVAGDKDYNVLIHDVADDPLTLKPIHADFYAVRMDRAIEAKVPLAFIGQSPAVQQEGGILVKVLHELEVKALPGDMPHEIEVHLDALEKIEDKIHVKDIKLPTGVTLRVDEGEVVALVEPPRSDAELEALEKKEEVAEVVEVKTEREVKAEAKTEEVPEEAEPKETT